MSQERSRAASERAVAAQDRVTELQTLRLRLASGGRLTPEDVETALRRCEESRQFAEEAHVFALAAHRHAASAHTNAALAADLVGDVFSAAHHRRAALMDENAADG